jgi:ribosomal protein L11 methyltransferase
MRTWPALELASLVRPELVQATLSEFRITAIDESSRAGAWQVGFTTAVDRDAAARALTRQFPDAVIRSIEVPDEDWVARSQATLTAVHIDGIVVAPPWDVPHAGLHPPLVVVIRPSMGFGTGHHATTRLCLSALQQAPVQGRTVIDVGTGSGLLAIAASRLGASRVVAIDVDPDAIDAARENLALNPGADVTLCDEDIRSTGPGSFEIVLANLTGALLRDAAAQLRALAGSGAHLILSGFLRTEEADVLRSFDTLAVTRRMEEEEWVCLTLQHA